MPYTQSDSDRLNPSKSSLSRFGLVVAFLCYGLTIGSSTLPAYSQGIPSAKQPIVQNKINPKVAKLQKLLKAKQWARADQETRLLLSDSSKVPNSLIQEIDRLWLAASNNRFGLSVQSKIWRESMAKYPKDSQKATDAFRDRVGWKIAQPRSGDNYDFISGDWLNESELNYSAQAPIGHFPWAGVSDAEVAKLMASVVDGCGSCTTDAMQLRNERFYNYLPQLFDRVKAAIGPKRIAL